MYKTIIFDFDGTLVDSTQLVSSIFKSLQEEFQLNHITNDDIRQFRQKSLKQQLAESGLPKMKLPRFIKRVHQEYSEHIRQLKWCTDIPELLKKLSNEPISLGVLSSNHQRNLEAFFNFHQVDYFEFIFSAKKLFSKGKHLKKIIKKYKLSAENILYVGDEVADVQACREVGVDVAAVCWGFDSKELLQSQEPTYLIEKPSELLLLLTTTQKS